MTGRLARRCGATLLASALLGLLAALPAAAASTHHTGTLPDGATWIADVPSHWNGTLLLYSHGYGPLTAADAPDPNTQADLLSEGYALAGSSYDPNGSWWALGSAVRDQFQTLTAVKAGPLPHAPRQVLAFGTSMGGLIGALEDQDFNGRIDGALTTCGLVGGGIQLNNYQLDGEYAISSLLAPGQSIKLVNFANQADSAASAAQLAAAAEKAQTTPQGRARLALAMAFLNVSTWAPSETMPGVYDYPTQEQEQYDDYFVANPSRVPGRGSGVAAPGLRRTPEPLQLHAAGADRGRARRAAAPADGQLGFGCAARRARGQRHEPESRPRRVHPVLARAPVGIQRPVQSDHRRHGSRRRARR